ncbi:hypothetical protein [Fimbriimonas ginsengisoli]|uniref:FecR protein domain-containing protein n=1 Tax=Fimbriimonas ginsengisoli Gsoil 348 TaxID=661478 RepID=A0A068NT05_FIMGI|nr:hypothetical protein [Fimbriimonas ginsengisoli]AIE84759.1 hypothetical protein OP10G_1391 [Fimbriimonas ginsengisoli Gsoil 348]
MRTHFATLSTFTVLALAIASATAFHNRRTHLAAQVGGHSVTASVEGSATLRANREEAVISSDFGTLTILPTQVLRDGKIFAKVRASSPIEIEFAEHRLSVTAR